MSGPNDDPQPSTAQNADEKSKLTCHLVSLPKIILTRIDEGKLPFINKSTPSKKTVKRLGIKNKTPLLSKPAVKKLLVDKQGDKQRKRGRPKIDKISSSKISKPIKSSTKSKLTITKKVNEIAKSPKGVVKPQTSTVKNMLKKTMLQKRSKIAIPPAKKPKLIPTKSSKPAPPKEKKQTPPKIKVDIPQTQPMDLDESEDEFLYDELIEELENTPIKRSAQIQQLFEKTTNITLKPNTGNKPPTIVKGGIVKKVNLPADLKSVTIPNNLNSTNLKPVATPSNLNSTIIPEKSVISNKSANNETYLMTPVSSDSTSQPQKTSPWSVSIPSQSKPSLKDILPSKPKKRTNPKPKSRKTPNYLTQTPKPPPKQPKVPTQTAKPMQKDIVDESIAVAVEIVKPRIGPKQMAKVVPLSHSLLEEDNLSDEYTEEETLENIDSEPIEVLSKIVSDPVKSNKVTHEINNVSEKLLHKSENSSMNGAKDDEDPHLDLLRILTDDSEEPLQLSPYESKESNVQIKCNPSPDNTTETKNPNNDVAESVSTDQTTESSMEADEEPPVRTIYELMNEISLQYPSWNLHIIPETNAFCIAQVTKGRLGLPTLKKCIELDPDNYSAKVYIHQYHIKRFDGVYDSEESIIALIQEINSIKA